MSESPGHLVEPKSEYRPTMKGKRALNTNVTMIGLPEALPEKELLTQYRHVYAGKGGWYGHKNGPSGPVSLLNAPFLTPRHRKELLRQAAEMSDKNTKPNDHRGGATSRKKRVSSSKNKHRETPEVKHTDYTLMSKKTVALQNGGDKTDDRNVENENKSKINNGKVNNESANHLDNPEVEVDTKLTVDHADDVLETYRSCSPKVADYKQYTTVRETEQKHRNMEEQSQNVNGSDARKYRKLQLFSRMSQEAQCAMNELQKDKKVSKKRLKDEVQRIKISETEKREVELEKANEELNRFAQTLTAGARMSDSDDDEDDEVMNCDVSSDRGHSLSSSQLWMDRERTKHSTQHKSTSRGRAAATRLPHIGATPHDYALKNSYNKNIPGVGKYKVVPTESSCAGNVFETTPFGYDSRYNVRHRDLDVEDETPGELIDRAVEKCSSWLNKYH